MSSLEPEAEATLPPELIQAVLVAAQAAAARLPSSQPLQPGQPSSDIADPALLPEDAAGAVTTRLSGAVQGEAVLVVAGELVQALQESPLGALELAPAVQPAFEAAAATLGQVIVEPGRELEAELALDSLPGVGAAVVVPLVNAAGEVNATFALALAIQAASAPAPPHPGSAGAATGQPGQPGHLGAAIPQARRAAGLELLRDVEMEVTAELGRTRMTVRELLSLAPGAVVELDRTAGSPADVLVNGTLLARGEVVVVDEDFGIRITEIVVETGDSADAASAAAMPGQPHAAAAG